MSVASANAASNWKERMLRRFTLRFAPVASLAPAAAVNGGWKWLPTL
jgi:hypothetical protein